MRLIKDKYNDSLINEKTRFFIGKLIYNNTYWYRDVNCDLVRKDTEDDVYYL